jgi:hypothetical protein
MDKKALKDLVYGGVSELIHNDKYYRYSTIGYEYCRFTDDGKIALEEFMNQMAILMHKADQESLDTRAKELVIKGLKGESV